MAPPGPDARSSPASEHSPPLRASPRDLLLKLASSARLGQEIGKFSHHPRMPPDRRCIDRHFICLSVPALLKRQRRRLPRVRWSPRGVLRNPRTRGRHEAFARSPRFHGPGASSWKSSHDRAGDCEQPAPRKVALGKPLVPRPLLSLATEFPQIRCADCQTTSRSVPRAGTASPRAPNVAPNGTFFPIFDHLFTGAHGQLFSRSRRWLLISYPGSVLRSFGCENRSNRAHQCDPRNLRDPPSCFRRTKPPASSAQAASSTAAFLPADPSSKNKLTKSRKFSPFIVYGWADAKLVLTAFSGVRRVIWFCNGQPGERLAST